MAVAWRVNRNQLFLHRVLDDWTTEIRRAHGDEIKTLTDILRNVYDKVITLPPRLLLPLSQHRAKLRRLVALSTPLYDRRDLLLQLPSLLLIVQSV